MAIPISLLIAHAPDMVTAATRLWHSWKGRTTPDGENRAADLETQLSAMGARLHALEEAAEAQAKVMKDLAEQMAAVTGALAAVSRKSHIALGLAGAALLVSLVTAVLLAMR